MENKRFFFRGSHGVSVTLPRTQSSHHIRWILLNGSSVHPFQPFATQKLSMFLSIQMDFIQHLIEFFMECKQQNGQITIFSLKNKPTHLPKFRLHVHFFTELWWWLQGNYNTPNNRFTRHGKPTSLKTSMLWSNSSCLSKLSSPRKRRVVLFLFGWEKRQNNGKKNSTQDSRIYNTKGI